MKRRRWTAADYVMATIMVAAVIGAGLADKPKSAAKTPAASPMPSDCDYFPSGLRGRPCADGREYERSGRMFWYWHYPDKPAGENWHD